MGWDRIGGQYGHFIGNLIARRVVSVRNCYLRIRGAGGPHRTSNDTLPSCHWLAVEWASGSIDPKETRTGTAKPSQGKESKGKCLCYKKTTNTQHGSSKANAVVTPLPLSLFLSLSNHARCSSQFWLHQLIVAPQCLISCSDLAPRPDSSDLWECFWAGN